MPKAKSTTNPLLDTQPLLWLLARTRKKKYEKYLDDYYKSIFLPHQQVLGLKIC